MSMKPWKGAAKLRAAKDSKGYGDLKPSLERRLGQAWGAISAALSR